MAKLNKLDSVTIYASTNLNHDDINTLTLLYCPLIKPEAYNLYMLLYSLVDRSSLTSPTFTHQFFLDLLNISLENLYKARVKLEAIGLLSTYKFE